MHRFAYPRPLRLESVENVAIRSPAANSESATVIRVRCEGHGPSLSGVR